MASILVAYESKHGATRGIAEWIGVTLTASGHTVDVRSVGDVSSVEPYEAFVIGSAAYMGSWLKGAAAFIRQHQTALAGRPVWLFSSGPLGTELTDAEGHDLLAVSAPKEFAEFKDLIHPRDMKVFFGALDPGKLAFPEKLLRKMPAGSKLLPEGDFRTRKLVEEWAVHIARELPVSAPSAVTS